MKMSDFLLVKGGNTHSISKKTSMAMYTFLLVLMQYV